MEVSDKVDRIGVHTAHCCKKCGCKYGDPDCPVELGAAEAEYLCEWCGERKRDMRREFLRMSLSELQETVVHLEKLIQKKQSEKGR